MKGYKKISEESVEVNRALMELDDNYDLDEQIRSAVHSPILGECKRTNIRDYKIVIYKKVS